MLNIYKSSNDNWKAKTKIISITIKFSNNDWILSIKLFKVFNIQINISDFVNNLKTKKNE